jgi:hypothetical protein
MNFRVFASKEKEAGGGGSKQDDAKPKLKKIDLPQTLIDEERINGYLTAMCNVKEARKLADLSDIAFYSDKSNTYQRYIPKTLEKENLSQVRITMEDGSHRYFKRLNNAADDVNPAGLKATAYIEIDEAGKITTKDGGAEIRLNFAGYTSLLDDTVQLVETLKEKRGSKIAAKLRDIYDAHIPRSQATQRSLATVDFVHHIIEDWNKEHPEIKVSHLIYGSHSMGAGNALVAQAVSEIEGIPTETTLAIEQVLAREQANRVEEDLRDSNSSLHKRIMEVVGASNGTDGLSQRIVAEADTLEADINNGKTYSIHAITINKNGHKPSISTVVNSDEKFGREVLQDVGEALEKKRRDKHSDEPKPARPLIDLWAEHKLKALLATAKTGKYHELVLSRSTESPRLLAGNIDIAPDTDPNTVIMR